uniref:uncharacterized protein LOC120344462 isoform X2 n=1 Tax=Styela clava TaxID=7725 RepID=UPI00193AC563|nr:uncharacterized protein LOC120344462 isoform X2 [Styela clava]
MAGDGAGDVEWPGGDLRGIVNRIEHAHIDRAQFFSPDGRLTKENVAIFERKFIDGVNKRSRRLSESTILRPFRNDLNDPEVEVVPKLSKTNFFRGGCALNEVEYSATNNRDRLPEKEKKKEVEVQLKSIHSHGRFIVLIGGAGSGKTTLLKRYCLLVLDGKIENMNGIEMIHYINIKDWSLKYGEYTPREILFSVFNVAESDVAEECGFNWLKKPENQKKFLLLLDGLDTAPWVLSGDNFHDPISWDQKATVPVIIYNILYRNIFPGCKILLTSREYAINKFSHYIKPDATIALGGLSQNSIVTLVKEISGDTGDITLESMLKKSLELMHLCSTPLFLIFVIVVYLNGEDIPENLSGLILTILKNHTRSKHLKSKKDVDQIMKNLMKLSLDGLKRGKYVFTRDDIQRNKIDVDVIKDFVISVPTPAKNVVCDQNLLEKDYSFFFVHQTIQELLAACELANLPILQYKELIDKQISTQLHVVVRQMLCGLIFNKSTAKMNLIEDEPRDITQKQEYLLESLRKDLNGENIPPMQMLNLLISICECGTNEGIVEWAKTNIKKISLSGIPLTTSDLHAVGSVTSHCDRLRILALDNCQLNAYSLKVLSDGLGESPVQIEEFDVCFNRRLVKNSMYYLHKIYTRVQKFHCWQCGFRKSDIQDFKQNPQVTGLEVSIQNVEEEQEIEIMFNDQNILDFSRYNTENHIQTLEELVINANSMDIFNVSLTEYERTSDLRNLCDLLKKCEKIGEFKISECELTEQQLDKIMQAIPDQEIQMVNVFLTPDIQPKGWMKIGQITRKFKAANLAVTSCSLTEDKLSQLRVSLDRSMIFSFDLSRNSNLTESCMKQVGWIIQNCEIKELIMKYCNLTNGMLKSLRFSLREAAELDKINISGNDKLGDDGFVELAQISDVCKTEQLDISDCNISSQQIRSFEDATHTTVLNILNVSHNRNMGKWGLRDLRKLVEKCQLKALFIRQCGLDEETFANFANNLENSQGESIVKIHD